MPSNQKAKVQTPLGLWGGIAPAAQGWVAYGVGSQQKGFPRMVLVSSPGRARELARQMEVPASAERPVPGKVLVYLGFSALGAEWETPDWAQALDSMAVLQSLRETPGRSVSLVTTPEALLSPAPNPKWFEAKTTVFKAGKAYDFGRLPSQLVESQYESAAVVEHPCQFAVRGGIIDLYPAGAQEPYRLDFFGDELESIHTFDPVTQRTLAKVDDLVLVPSPAAALGAMDPDALGWLGKKASWTLVEPEELETVFSAREGDAEKKRQAGRLAELIRGANPAGIAEIASPGWFFPEPEQVREEEAVGLDLYEEFALGEEVLAEKRLAHEEMRRSAFWQKLREWQESGDRLVFVYGTAGDRARLQEILEADETTKPLLQDSFWREGYLRGGFRLGANLRKAFKPFAKGGRKGGLVVISEVEVFGRRRKAPHQKSRKEAHHAEIEQLLDFSELVEGDLLVHLEHGICRFRGIGKIPVGDEGEREVITLAFEDSVELHLPLAESHLLTRYVGLQKGRPQLARLGSGKWEKTRREAEKATMDFAAEMLRMHAVRESGEGFAFPPDTPWQKEFELAFPYRETPGQEKAIVECKHDMETGKPMDRLLCGDVGFGKTEIALRAAFKAVMGGKQVAILAPTTVLAQQHFETFLDRTAEFPVVVEMLSRFRTGRQAREILRSLREGKIDILVGTHRLLGKDVTFKDLGLVVIDEEHRFGLKHKEAIKRMRVTVDVLTMSATPIPRTLHLALSGARDLSVIETPPVNRLPIQTVVKTFDLELVKKAIQFEIDRGGQVFYLHNRVETITSLTARLQELMPDVRFVCGHGQMRENELEKVMHDFVERRYDVLVCTTIIESGIDIPNCNTLIVEAADRFGLSQLYQLRGRVGRFTRQAYAYLFLHRHGKVLENARKRLNVLRQYNQLGSGFRIAMRDLELRGAGNLLGVKQSGHIAGVGFDLYCQLLRHSIARLKGEPSALVPRARVNLDFVVTGGEGERRAVGDRYQALREEEVQTLGSATIQAEIPPTYLAEPRLRIDFYRRLSLLEKPAEVKKVREEMEDRFGKVPEAVQALLWVTLIRTLAQEAGLAEIESHGDRLKGRFSRHKGGDYWKIGGRFPRLTKRDPLRRLEEIAHCLQKTSF
ncbi:MAG: transcription-repair coupling factor [Opitutales bacterium]|nr:transcription-repair coupling factor [Opitutales bacterium]